jgi:hypothetical protein
VSEVSVMWVPKMLITLDHEESNGHANSVKNVRIKPIIIIQNPKNSRLENREQQKVAKKGQSITGKL